MHVSEVNIDSILKAMQDQYNTAENTFAITQVLFDLETFCPKHGFGERNLILLRYFCSLCNKPLRKTRRL